MYAGTRDPGESQDWQSYLWGAKPLAIVGTATAIVSLVSDLFDLGLRQVVDAMVRLYRSLTHPPIQFLVEHVPWLVPEWNTDAYALYLIGVVVYYRTYTSTKSHHHYIKLSGTEKTDWYIPAEVKRSKIAAFLVEYAKLALALIAAILIAAIPIIGIGGPFWIIACMLAFLFSGPRPDKELQEKFWTSVEQHKTKPSQLTVNDVWLYASKLSSEDAGIQGFRYIAGTVIATLLLLITGYQPAP